MNRMVNLKKSIKRILIILIGIFIIYSIYIQLEYRQYINQSQDQNYHYLFIISAHGNNLASRLEEFVHLPIEDENISEVKGEFYNNWRIVNSENRSIYFYVSFISTLHVEDDEEASDWDLLRYSLLRVDGFIFGMTNKFLEDYSYAISS